MSKDLDRRGRARVQTVNDLPSKTVQADTDLADIKQIIKRYQNFGIVDHLDEVQVQFMDVTELPEDFAAVTRYAAAAKEEFMRLDPRVRRIFENNEAEWLDAAHDGLKEEQRNALVRLGYLEAPQAASDSGSVGVDSGGAGGASVDPGGSDAPPAEAE